MKNSNKKNGFTLIEILISAVVGVMVLLLINQSVFAGSRAVQQIGTQSEMLEDIRNTGMMVADQVKSAAYIYTPGTSITFGGTLAYTYQNPSNNSSSWTIGTDPILAFLLSPANPSGTCNAGSPNDACMEFVAYYPVLRANVFNAVASPINASTLAADPSGTVSWMLYEYRQFLGFNALSITNTPPNNFNGSNGRMVIDHISPNGTVVNGAPVNGFTVNLTTCQTINADGSTSRAACTTNSTIDRKYSALLGDFFLSGLSFKNGDKYNASAISFPIAPQNLAQN